MELIPDGIAFLFGYVIVLALAVHLYYKAGFDLSHVSLPMVFFAQFLVSSYLGIPWLLLGDNHPVYSDSRLIVNVWAYSGISLLIITMVWWTLGKLGRRSKIGSMESMGVISYLSEGRSIQADLFPMARTVSAFALATLLILFFLSTQTNPVPLIASLGENVGYSELAVLRSSWNYDFQGQVSLYRLAVDHILPFIAFAFLAGYLISRNRKLLFWSILAAIVTSMALLTSLEKSPVLTFFAGLIFVYMYSRKRALDFGRKTLALTFLLVVLLYVVYVLIWKQEDFLIASLDRLFTGEIRASYSYLAMFPRYRDFLLGRTFPNPFGLFPWRPFPLTTEVQRFTHYYLFGRSLSIAGSENAPFWAEGYVNFGPVGVILFSAVAALLVYGLDRWLREQPATSVNIAFYAYSAFFWGNLAITLLLPFLFPLNWILVAALRFFLNLTAVGTGRTRRLASPRRRSLKAWGTE